MDKDKQEKIIEELKNKKDEYTHKFFVLAFKVGFIFLIPALLAVWLGKNIDKSYNGGEQKFAPFILFCSFVFSWIFVIFKYKRMSDKYKEIKDVYKKAEKVNQNNNLN